VEKTSHAVGIVVIGDAQKPRNRSRENGV
jgi:hypothetical protein